jgi:hypothetical protein
MEASMKRRAVSAAALAFSSILIATPVQANGGGHGGGMHHGGFHHHDGRFHHHFFHHGFFRPFFFFGAAIYAPYPISFYPPTPYPSYLYAPMEGDPGCYEYQTTTVINGQQAPAWGMACLQPDGTWRPMN